MSKFKTGDKVRYIGKDHNDMPEFYPLVGTIGTVVKEDGNTDWYIQWPKGSTSKEDCWYCDENDIELVENVDMTNEEIWEMLRPKIEKNFLLNENYRVGSCGFVPTYDCDTVHNAIVIAYRSGYERAMKGRPFKIGEKKKKDGHWEPVDPSTLPKEGTRVRYSRHIDDKMATPFSKWTGIQIGEETVVLYDLTDFGVKNIHNKPEGIDRLSSYKHPDRFDMWVEDNE